MAWQNLKAIRAGIRLSIRPSWMLSGGYNDLWLASATDGFYGASGAHIGREYDVQFHIASTETWNAVRASAYVRTREFLVRTNRAHSYTYPYAMLNYNVN